MVPGDHLAVDGTEEQNNPTKAQEVLPARDPVSRGNTIVTDLISTQPLPAGSSQDAAGFQKPQCDVRKPTCPQCGLLVPDHRLPALSPGLSQREGSDSSVHSSGSRKSRNKTAGPHQAAATHADSCVQLLLACLSCQGSLLFQGLMEACSSCFHTLCISCCYACARCCSAIQEAPVEELNCHTHCCSVLFESCCEPTECLKFCVECCEICHRS
uniref:myoD family inhibitor domain-containing protein-like isoform X2 n=1 Tax=Scatophagus argus TaxID=75038 RepID=UPI001ED7D967|nr:myoD family inhibitor domain-containing protein-like isoform X2 [Scatophagus argus]